MFSGIFDIFFVREGSDLKRILWSVRREKRGKGAYVLSADIPIACTHSASSVPLPLGGSFSVVQIVEIVAGGTDQVTGCTGRATTNTVSPTDPAILTFS